MKKIIADYVSAMVFSIIGFFAFIYLHPMIGFVWGGDKGQLFSGMFLGLPLGMVLGFLLIDGFLFEMDTRNFPGIVSSFVTCILGNLAGVYLADNLGGEFLLFFPFLLILICTYVYNLWLPEW